MSDLARQMLQQNHVSITEARIFLLNLFISHAKPLSYAFIKKQLDKHATRFTLHRTLKVFLGKNLIHGMLNEDGTRTYLIRCNEEDKHVTRLHCKKCGETYTIADLPVSKLFMLKKYNIENIDILIRGICEHCKN